MSQNRLRSKELKVSELQKQLQHVNFNAAGIDVGSDRHLVAVPEGRDDVAVREFGAFTADLHALANWLSKCGVTTVAMESTGVYWIPVFELLERLGFEVKLVDARRVKNVSARKLAVLYYTMLKNGNSYVEVGQATYEQRYRQRRFSAMQKQALAMGYQLVPA